MNKTAWIIFSLLTVGILATLIMVSGGTKLDVTKVDLSTIQTANKQDGQIADHVFGKTGSKVTLIEYGDFQCPACGSIHSTVRKITEEYKDQLQFVFRNFPLAALHANAKASAAAVEAAGLQGKYWEMHNKIYESQDAWSTLSGEERTSFYTKAATDLGLDVNKFKTDMASQSVNSKLDYDYALGKKANVEGTPTFYLSGKKLDQSAYVDEATFIKTIDAELKKAGITLPTAN